MKNHRRPTQFQKQGEERRATPDAAADPLLRSVDTTALEIQGWDFVAETSGARLWARARNRVAQLARLHRMSRAEFLVFTILTVAAHRATGVEPGTAVDEPISPVRRSTPLSPPTSRGSSFIT